MSVDLGSSPASALGTTFETPLGAVRDCCCCQVSYPYDDDEWHGGEVMHEIRPHSHAFQFMHPSTAPAWYISQQAGLGEANKWWPNNRDAAEYLVGHPPPECTARERDTPPQGWEVPGCDGEIPAPAAQGPALWHRLYVIYAAYWETEPDGVARYTLPADCMLKLKTFGDEHWFDVNDTRDKDYIRTKTDNGTNIRYTDDGSLWTYANTMGGHKTPHDGPFWDHWQMRKNQPWGGAELLDYEPYWWPHVDGGIGGFSMDTWGRWWWPTDAERADLYQVMATKLGANAPAAGERHVLILYTMHHRKRWTWFKSYSASFYVKALYTTKPMGSWYPGKT